MEDLVPEETETGAALKSQLPQTEGSGVTAQGRVTQDEPNYNTKTNDYLRPIV